MTKEIKLSAQSRSEANGKAKKIRANGYVPAMVYGSGKDNAAVKVKRHDFDRVFDEAGESNLIDLIIDDKQPIKVIIKDVQQDNISGGIIHVDLYQVDMSKEITTEIPLNFVGESAAVKDLGGTLIKNIDSLEVECLPSNLVDHIDIDISGLKTFDDLIRMSDIKLPAGMKLVSQTNEVIVGAAEAVKEEESVAAPVTAEETSAEPAEAASESSDESAEKQS